jgi:hypothetical protein
MIPTDLKKGLGRGRVTAAALYVGLHFLESPLILGFWTLSIVRNSITRKHNVSETGSVSVLR